MNPPMYLLLLLPCHLLYHSSYDNHIFFPEIFLFSPHQIISVIPPVCDADPSSVEEKSQSIRHEAKSQLTICHHPVYWPRLLQTLHLH